MHEQLFTSIIGGYAALMLLLHFIVYANVKRNVLKGEQHLFTSSDEAFMKTRKAKEWLQTYYVYANFSMLAMLVAASIHIAIQNNASMYDYCNIACVYAYALILWISYAPRYYARISTLHRIYLHERLERVDTEQPKEVDHHVTRSRKTKKNHLEIAKEH